MVNLAVLDSSHILKTKSKMSLSLLTKEPGGKSKELFMMSKIKDAEKKIHDETEYKNMSKYAWCNGCGKRLFKLDD